MDKQSNLLKVWKQRLSLVDWNIELHDNALPTEFINDDVAGECEWQEVNKTAVIRILDPACYGKRLIPFNFERILVHELLHIKFSLLDSSENNLQNRIVHQLIEDLAKAFVSI